MSQRKQKQMPGEICWFVDGRLHREDGPAILSTTAGTSRWFLDGVEYTEVDHNREVARRRANTRSRFAYQKFQSLYHAGETPEAFEARRQRVLAKLEAAFPEKEDQ